MQPTNEAANENDDVEKVRIRAALRLFSRLSGCGQACETKLKIRIDWEKPLYGVIGQSKSSSTILKILRELRVDEIGIR